MPVGAEPLTESQQLRCEEGGLAAGADLAVIAACRGCGGSGQGTKLTVHLGKLLRQFVGMVVEPQSPVHFGLHGHECRLCSTDHLLLQTSTGIQHTHDRSSPRSQAVLPTLQLHLLEASRPALGSLH